MATKLKALKVRRVALVDSGANPDAFIRFAKRAAQAGAPADNLTPETAQDERGFAQRIIDAIAKTFGAEREAIAKEGKTFTEVKQERNAAQVYEEASQAIYLFLDSVRSILWDEEADAAAKQAKLLQSNGEFNDAFETAIYAWAKGQSAQVETEGAVILAVKRNILNSLKAELEPIADAGTQPAETQDSEPLPIVKGATDMKFDITKMTPEERATLEDLSKRYGQQDEAQTEPTKPAEEMKEDVAKALSPEITAELETLRKFRKEAEEKQFLSVAKKYELLGKKPEELAPVLKSLKAVGEDTYNAFVSVLDANLEALEGSGAFGEIGKRGGQDTGDGSWAKIEAAAQEIQKSKPSMTFPQAIDEACTAHPDLLEQYEKSRA